MSHTNKFALVFVFLLPTICFADRVCVVKDTQRLIPGTLITNALNAGYKESDIEEREVTPVQWEQIKQDQLIVPADATNKNKKDKRDLAKEKLKGIGNLTQQDLDALFP